MERNYILFATARVEKQEVSKAFLQSQVFILG